MPIQRRPRSLVCRRWLSALLAVATSAAIGACGGTSAPPPDAGTHSYDTWAPVLPEFLQWAAP